MLSEDSSELLSGKFITLKQSVTELSAKIDNLLAKNSNLQMEINFVPELPAINFITMLLVFC